MFSLVYDFGQPPYRQSTIGHLIKRNKILKITLLKAIKLTEFDSFDSSPETKHFSKRNLQPAKGKERTMCKIDM